MVATVGLIVRARNELAGLQRLEAALRHQVRYRDMMLRKVLVDDCSIDGTPEMAAQWGWEVVSLHPGEFTFPHALNRGVEYLGSTGTPPNYVATISAHSWPVYADYFWAALQVFEEHTMIGAIYGPAKAPKDAPCQDRLTNLIYWGLLMKGDHQINTIRPGFISNISAIYRLEALTSVGGFDEQMAGGAEDLRTALNLFRRGWKLWIVPGYSVYHSHYLHFWQLRQLRAQHQHWIEGGKIALAGGDRPFRRGLLWYRDRPDWDVE